MLDLVHCQRGKPVEWDASHVFRGSFYNSFDGVVVKLPQTEEHICSTYIDDIVKLYLNLFDCWGWYGCLMIYIISLVWYTLVVFR